MYNLLLHNNNIKVFYILLIINIVQYTKIIINTITKKIKITHTHRSKEIQKGMEGLLVN